MTTNPQYIYYNETDGTWQPATLEELAAINNPELPICPLNADGTPGPQTTYAAISNRAIARASLNADNAAKKNTIPRHTHHSAPHHSNTEQNLNYTLNYIRAVFNLCIIGSSIGAVYALAPRSMNPMLIILLGLLVALLEIVILQVITKPSAKK